MLLVLGHTAVLYSMLTIFIIVCIKHNTGSGSKWCMHTQSSIERVGRHDLTAVLVVARLLSISRARPLYGRTGVPRGTGTHSIC